MLTEWIKAMLIFANKGYRAITLDVNNRKYSRKSIVVYYAFFLCIPCLCVIFLPNGISEKFIDYIKDIFAIFIGFFVTALTFIYDKLNISKIPSQGEIDSMSAKDRPKSEDIVRMKQEHYYTIRFFYSIGFNILYATLTLLFLIPVIFWNNFFTIDISEYTFVLDLAKLDFCSLLTGAHIVFLLIYRLIVFSLTFKVFFFTVYMITSLLQVLISKKKI